MNWNDLKSIEELNTLILQSEKQAVVIVKHSTRCSISSMAMSRLERSWKDDEMTKCAFYVLDLLAYRDVSAAIAEKTGVYHESPQLIVIYHGKAVYDSSHMSISYDALKQQIDLL